MSTEGKIRCRKCLRFFHPKGIDNHTRKCKGRDGIDMMECPKCGKSYYKSGYYSHIQVCKGNKDTIGKMQSTTEIISKDINTGKGPFIVANDCYEWMVFAENIEKVNEIIVNRIGIGEKVGDIYVYEISNQYSVKQTVALNLVKKA